MQSVERYGCDRLQPGQVLSSSRFRRQARPLMQWTPEILAARVGTICREGCHVILQKCSLPRHCYECVYRT